MTTPSGTDNGSVTVAPQNASASETVAITVTPDDGYVLDKLTVSEQRRSSGPLNRGLPEELGMVYSD